LGSRVLLVTAKSGLGVARRGMNTVAFHDARYLDEPCTDAMLRIPTLIAGGGATIADQLGQCSATFIPVFGATVKIGGLPRPTPSLRRAHIFAARTVGTATLTIADADALGNPLTSAIREAIIASERARPAVIRSADAAVTITLVWPRAGIAVHTIERPTDATSLPRPCLAAVTFAIQASHYRASLAHFVAELAG